MSAKPKKVDVLVIGGGPAGSTVALELAGAGVSVAVLERSSYDTQRFGETLPPDITPLLQRLGVWDAFQTDHHVPSPGIVVAWESKVPYVNDFLFNPFGDGWHVDRTCFDRMLADQCDRVGATVFRESRIRSCDRTVDSRWHVEFESRLGRREFEATFLVDATGRSAWLARSQGATRIVRDRLVAVIGFGRSSSNEDRRTMIEAAPNGWWYAALLPDLRVVAAFMTDFDMVPHGQHELRRFWQRQLCDSPLIRSLFADLNTIGTLRVKVSGTMRLDFSHGAGWLAVGDAAMAFDPLSSLGVLKTLESGCLGAKQIAALLHGMPDAMTPYTAWLESEFADYASNYNLYYGQVRRWPNSLFWKRRHSA